ncbi:hypothetical protein Pcinc_004397 [Petrolisthes cinctipes]|uniref:Uncharacterized protein n=1 Tax=Petrolisthes cinctipes TaxID=88211 RepID=A0AAE1GES5_PETCI|nr:hypothetical protein Pcinc_004397 [Petrolisthes cinctipes]
MVGERRGGWDDGERRGWWGRGGEGRMVGEEEGRGGEDGRGGQDGWGREGWKMKGRGKVGIGKGEKSIENERKEESGEWRGEERRAEKEGVGRMRGKKRIGRGEKGKEGRSRENER